MLVILFALANLAFALFIFFLTLAFVTGAPFVPSTNVVSKRMIELAKIKSGQRIYDLGSGDGRLLFLAAALGARTVGYEINPFLVFWTWLRMKLTRTPGSVNVYWKNFWQANFSDADTVFVYLLPWRMETLERKLKTELSPGTTVVSNSFIFPNWKMTAADETHHIYVFRV